MRQPINLLPTRQVPMRHTKKQRSCGITEPHRNKPLTLEQIKQLNLGDTVTIVHSDKITYLDHECFETLYEVWGLADVKDGTVEVYACEPKAGERDG